jgi:hypothetical protein
MSEPTLIAVRSGDIAGPRGTSKWTRRSLE